MASEYKENTIATLKALRTSEQGAFLDGGTGNTSDDILLHHEQQTAKVSVGDEVTVFLYKDPKGRLTASMRLPKLKDGQIGYVEVINTTNFGCFVDVGTERGIFMPHAEMRGIPKEGEHVWVRLYVDKSGRMAVSMDVDDAMRRASKPATEAKKGQMIKGAIYNKTQEGIFLITPERWIAFIHQSEIVGNLRVGELIEARITYLREDGRVNASMRPIKEQALVIDGERILRYLHNHNGRMPLGDGSSSMLIQDTFHISKAAFKRAIGHLMKQRFISQDEGWTTMTEAGQLHVKAILDAEAAAAESAEASTETEDAQE